MFSFVCLYVARERLLHRYLYKLLGIHGSFSFLFHFSFIYTPSIYIYIISYRFFLSFSFCLIPFWSKFSRTCNFGSHFCCFSSTFYFMHGYKFLSIMLQLIFIVDQIPNWNCDSKAIYGRISPYIHTYIVCICISSDYHFTIHKMLWKLSSSLFTFSHKFQWFSYASLSLSVGSHFYFVPNKKFKSTTFFPRSNINKWYAHWCKWQWWQNPDIWTVQWNDDNECLIKWVSCWATAWSLYLDSFAQYTIRICMDQSLIKHFSIMHFQLN